MVGTGVALGATVAVGTVVAVALGGSMVAVGGNAVALAGITVAVASGVGVTAGRLVHAAMRHMPTIHIPRRDRFMEQTPWRV